MQSSEIVQIVITFISTVGAVLCAYFGSRSGKRMEPTPHRKPRWTVWTFGLYACVLIAVVNTGILISQLVTPEPKTEVKITYPINQSLSEQSEMVKGTYQKVSDENVVWVVIFSQEIGSYYPQNYPADLGANGNWSSPTYIGNPQDINKKFDIVVVVANTSAQDAFNAYLSSARDKNNYPGLARLPDGAVIYDRLTVIRK